MKRITERISKISRISESSLANSGVNDPTKPSPALLPSRHTGAPTSTIRFGAISPYNLIGKI
jgi:hypothetical protein